MAATDVPTPENEEGRLHLLRGLGFERMRETRFGKRLVTLGATHFDVPHCFIGIVREAEEVFLATAAELPEPIPRQESICAHAITQEDVLVVEDVPNDERFADNTVLRESGVRWYAGVPILVDDQPIGTFCLMDQENRSFTVEQRDHLKLFAEEVSEQIELRNRKFDSDARRLKKEIAHKLEALELS